MSRTGQPYRQHLPALDLSIERFTDAVPGDGGWYVTHGQRPAKRFRSLKQARREWDRVLAEVGWSPLRGGIDADAALKKESAERWARNRAG